VTLALCPAPSAPAHLVVVAVQQPQRPRSVQRPNPAQTQPRPRPDPMPPDPDPAPCTPAPPTWSQEHICFYGSITVSPQVHVERGLPPHPCRSGKAPRRRKRRAPSTATLSAASSARKSCREWPWPELYIDAWYSSEVAHAVWQHARHVPPGAAYFPTFAGRMPTAEVMS